MKELFDGKTILITGGTGSFGRWMLTELLKTNVGEVRIFSRDEEKQLDVKRETKDKRISLWLGDVRDSERVLEVCRGVDVVFHAAAQKIIDSCEQDPYEALKTNVLGTWNVRRAAIACEVERAVLISTDKAVKPVNLYGMTKGIAEKVWVLNSKFTVVRYGNVVGSRGSVVPFFKRLIAERKPLPITHLSMTRFLITLKQACALVFYALEHSRGGEIYVPNLPACRIVDLAKAMGGDGYPLEIIGVRAGEKIHECLIQEDEMLRTELKDGYYVIGSKIQCKGSDLTEEYTSDKARMLDQTGIIGLLKDAGWA